MDLKPIRNIYKKIYAEEKPAYTLRVVNLERIANHRGKYSAQSLRYNRTIARRFEDI